MPIDHMDLFVASVAMYNNLNVSSTNLFSCILLTIMWLKEL